jgi:hypothetical protein
MSFFSARSSTPPGRYGARRLTPDFGKFMVEETEKWVRVVKFSGAKPD